MIFGAHSPEYLRVWWGMGESRWNGAYYYALEIEGRIIPEVETDRDWVLLNSEGMCRDHSIVFVHDNLNAERYRWLEGYDDLLLVCGIPETVPKVAHLGTAVYLPLSIDVAEVSRHRRKRRSGTCYAGRVQKIGEFPSNVDVVSGLPRDEFLDRLSRYRHAYCVGRTALEAKCLGVEVLPYDPRFPDPDRWEVMDNLTAARILQQHVDRIDG